jgi:gluconolactonase
MNCSLTPNLRSALPLKIDRRLRCLDHMIPDGVGLERLCAGFGWAEGPVWIPDEGCLLFSDICNDVMYKWKSESGLSIFRKPSGYANGNALDQHGRLVTCEHRQRRVSRTNPTGQVVAIVSSYQNQRFNSPNDVVVRSDGSVFFTDPAYGLEKHMGGPANREIPFQGVYRVVPEGNTAILETADLGSPNGLALSPDESQLYINDSDCMQILVFEVEPNGALTGGRLFAQFDSGSGRGWPDGMKTDGEGNLFAAGPGGIWVFDSRGSVLGMLEIPETVTNLAWGGSDRRELYITTALESFEASCLYRVKTRGAGGPARMNCRPPQPVGV